MEEGPHKGTKVTDIWKTFISKKKEQPPFIVSRGCQPPPRKINPHLKAQLPPSSSDINPQHQGWQPPAQKRD